MLTISILLGKFQHPAYQARLERLSADLGSQDPEEWARSLYLTLLTDPSDHRAVSLNRDRKACLEVLYELVDIWEASPDPQAFQQDIIDIFNVSRLHRILRLCLVLDRAQSLWKMQIPASRFVGMHWYCKKMVDPESTFAKAFPEEHKALKAVLVGYQGSGTMNRRLFKVLYTESFGLLQDHDLARWACPAPATFFVLPQGSQLQADRIPRPEPVLYGHGQSSLVPRNPFSIQEPFETQVLQFVIAYNDPLFQARLARLYHSRGSQDPETWARNLYSGLSRAPSNQLLSSLNQDRKACLKLLYDLVNDWERNGFSAQYERAIQQVFKPHRLSRILGVCLVLDRAQSLNKMVLPNGKVGMHWFSSLHFSPDGWDTALTKQERSFWTNEVLWMYPGSGTMNKRLYRLVCNETFGLYRDDSFARWSKPELAW